MIEYIKKRNYSHNLMHTGRDVLNLVGESTSNKVKSENIFSEGNNIHFRTVENINMCGPTMHFGVERVWRPDKGPLNIRFPLDHVALIF